MVAFEQAFVKEPGAEAVEQARAIRVGAAELLNGSLQKLAIVVYRWSCVGSCF